MNIFRLTLRFLFFAAAVFVFTGSAQAQATRTWVSGVGDDINPCSRTAPCKTFAGAISKTAKGGEINCIDAGGFGSVTITKSVTIDGTGVMSSILAGQTAGITINITDSNDVGIVRLRGISINGASVGTTGVKVLAAGKVFIENTVIDGFTEGIGVASAGSTQVFIKDSSVSNNSGNGISATTSGSQVAMSNVCVIFNGAGLATSAGGTIVSYNNIILFGNKKDGAPTSMVKLR